MSGISAEHFTVKEWLDRVDTGIAQIPEFQRDIVWPKQTKVKFLNAILKNRPVGCLLLLKVKQSDEVPFDPRPIEGARPSSAKPIEYLILDGQQRITALWTALMGKNETRTFFISCKDPSNSEGDVRSEAKRSWHHDPKQCLDRGLVPLSLLRFAPLSEGRQEVNAWIDTALAGGQGNPDAVIKKQRALEGWIANHSEQVRNFKIPHLLMPEETTPDQAIETFVQSNTQSISLKKFDIATAHTLGLGNDNLRSSRGRAWDEIAGVQKYVDLPTLGDLLLKVSCLRSNLPPTQSNYNKRVVLDDVAENLEEIIAGVRWVVELLEEDRIWDSRRLPSVVPFRVLPALFACLSEKSVERGAMIKTARAYLWRAFLTDRYKSAAASLLKEDYDGLRDVFQNGGTLKRKVPIWRCKLPNVEEIQGATWPNRSALPKALLAVSLRRGARDIGSGEEIRQSSINNREYHHIFPEAYLERRARTVPPHLAMNCMLVRGRTNKEASDKPPLEYLQSLVVRLAGSRVGDKDFRVRLDSHLVPMSDLGIGKKSVAACYRTFLHHRALMVSRDMKALANGNEP